MTTGRQFSNACENLHAMIGFVLGQAQVFGFVNTCHIELAVDEALSNVINHSGSQRVEISCYPTNPSGIKIVIMDDGQPFNPLKPIKNDESFGGYGIDLILERMDHVEYQRDRDRNILTLIKYRL